jgi:hypothetical protein
VPRTRNFDSESLRYVSFKLCPNSRFFELTFSHKLEERQTHTLTELEENRKEIDVLEYVLQSHIRTPPPAFDPPKSPAIIHSPEVIIKGVKDHLVVYVCESMQPLIQSLRTDMEAMVDSRRTEIYGAVWGKLQQMLQFLDTIRSWMQREQIQLGSARQSDFKQEQPPQPQLQTAEQIQSATPQGRERQPPV